jgi:hypothetical protein
MGIKAPLRGFFLLQRHTIVSRIIEADYFEKESEALGATNENIKSVRSLVQAALDERDDIVSYELIRNTTGESEYRPWVRIRGKKSGVRIAVELYQENNDDIVLIHVVIPRDAHTYDDIEKLWLKYRSKI